MYRYYPLSNGVDYFFKINYSRYALEALTKQSRRLFRVEVTHLYHFIDDNWMCIAKKGIFQFNKESKLFEKCFDIEKGSRPLNFCQTEDGIIYSESTFITLNVNQ